MINTQNPASLKSIRIIYYALLIGPALFMSVVLRMNDGFSAFSFDASDPMILVLLIMLVPIAAASVIVPRMHLKSVDASWDLSRKLSIFQSAFIIKAGLWAGIINFALVVFMMNSNPAALSIAVIGLLIIATYYPGINSISKGVSLTEDEIKSLMK